MFAFNSVIVTYIVVICKKRTIRKSMIILSYEQDPVTEQHGNKPKELVSD